MPGVLMLVDHDERDTAMLGRIGIGADQRKHRVGSVRGRGPDLLSVDDEIVAVAHGARGQRGEIGAGARLAVALRPGDFTVEDRRQVLFLLLVRAVDDQGRSEHVNAGAADRRRAGLGELLIEDELLHRREAAAAVLGRPVRRDPMPRGEGRMPVDRGRQRGRIIGLAVVLPGPFGHCAAGGEIAIALRQALIDHCRHFAAEGRLFGCISPVQRSLRFVFPFERR